MARSSWKRFAKVGPGIRLRKEHDYGQLCLPPPVVTDTHPHHAGPLLLHFAQLLVDQHRHQNQRKQS